MFVDPRAREAYKLYTEVSRRQSYDDDYMAKKRVQMAGMVAASFLGMKEYIVGRVNPSQGEQQSGKPE